MLEHWASGLGHLRQAALGKMAYFEDMLLASCQKF